MLATKNKSAFLSLARYSSVARERTAADSNRQLSWKLLASAAAAAAAPAAALAAAPSGGDYDDASAGDCKSTLQYVA